MKALRRRHSFASRIVLGSVLVATATACSLAAASAAIAHFVWEAGEFRRVLASADELATGIRTEAERESTSLETAAANALAESGLAGDDRLEVWRGSTLVAAHPPGAVLGPGTSSSDVGRRWIVASRPIGADAVLLVAAPREPWPRGLRVFLLSLAVAAPFCLALAWGVGRTVARVVTRPLADFRSRVLAAHPDGAFPSTGRRDLPAEVADLDDAFRQLWDRLGAALARESEFAANASHELRSPLTRLRLRLERASNAGPKAVGSDLADARQEVDRMVRLVDSLLILARDVSAGVSGEALNLADVVRAVARRVLANPEDAAITAPDEAMVRGDEDLLAIAAENLLDNALKFRRRSEPVRVNVDHGAKGVTLTVTSPGARIASSDRERVFDRFYRAAEARSATHGHGLGLPLCRHIARLHGGEARCVSGDDEDARFVLELPAWTATLPKP